MLPLVLQSSPVGPTSLELGENLRRQSGFPLKLNGVVAFGRLWATSRVWAKAQSLEMRSEFVSTNHVRLCDAIACIRCSGRKQ